MDADPKDLAPISVEESLAQLRSLSKSVRSLEEWRERGRKCTPQEYALARAQHKEWMCKAHSVRTGLPCTIAAIRGADVCIKHGGNNDAVKANAQQRLMRQALPAVRRLKELMKQEDHLPTAFKAAEHILSRALGPLKTEGLEKEGGVTVNIGFLTPAEKVVEGTVVRVEPDDDHD